MTIETLVPNGDDGGWPTGSYLDVDEGIASVDGVFLETNTDPDVVILDLSASAIVDGDTVNSVTVKIHAKDGAGGGTNSIDVDLLIGGTGQGQVGTGTLTGTLTTYTLTENTLWDLDWTAAELAGMQLEVTSAQSGKGYAATWSIDAIEVEIDYTAAAGGGGVEILRRRILEG